MPVTNQLSRLNAIMDEITNLLLKPPEPHRTRYLKRVMPASEWLRDYQVERLQFRQQCHPLPHDGC